MNAYRKLFTWFVIRLWVLSKRDAAFAPGTRPSEG